MSFALMIMNQKNFTSGWRSPVAVMLFLWASICGAAEQTPRTKEFPSRADIREQLQKLGPVEREARINALRREFDSPSPMTQGRRPNGAMNRDARQRMERLRREFQNLSPEERQARLAELRRQGAAMSPTRAGDAGAAAFSRLTPAQREEFLKLRRQLQDLPEEERLARFREFFKQAGVSMNGEGDRSASGNQRQQFQRMREQFQARLKELEQKRSDGTITEQEARQLERMKQSGNRGRKEGKRRQ